LTSGRIEEQKKTKTRLGESINPKKTRKRSVPEKEKFGKTFEQTVFT